MHERSVKVEDMFEQDPGLLVLPEASSLLSRQLILTRLKILRPE